MEEKRKLRRFLRCMGFSIGLLSACVSCKQEGVEEYSFRNNLDIDVELVLFTSSELLKDAVDDVYHIRSGENVSFISLKSEDRYGYGMGFFCTQIDSAKLKIEGEVDYIVIWRSSEDPLYLTGYNMKWNFFCEWIETLHHSSSHVEYRYLLELTED